MVIEVNDQLCQGHLVGHQDSLSLDVFHLFKSAAPRSYQIHNCADIAAGRENRDIHPRLFDLLDIARGGENWWGIHLQQPPPLLWDIKFPPRSGGQDIPGLLPVQSLLYEFPWQTTPEATAETTT